MLFYEKNNKVRKSIKIRKKTQKIKAGRRNKKDNNKSYHDTSSPIFHMMENPLANFSVEERRKSLIEVGRNSEKRFQKSLIKLQDILKQYDMITLLSILSAYGLTAGLGKEGVLPSTHSNPLEQSDVEICQALALQVNPKDSGFTPVKPDVVLQAWDTLIDISKSFSFRRMTGKLVDVDEEQAAVLLLQERIRVNTQNVRNWGISLK